MGFAGEAKWGQERERRAEACFLLTDNQKPNKNHGNHHRTPQEGQGPTRLQPETCSIAQDLARGRQSIAIAQSFIIRPTDRDHDLLA